MIITILTGIAVALLAASAVLTLLRISRGPTSLDRVVGADVLVAVVIAALALEAIIDRNTTTLPVMLVLSLLGFAGSVSIARFVAERDTAQHWNTPDSPRTTDERDPS